MRAIRPCVLAALTAALAAGAAAAAVDPVWRSPREMPEAALTRCAAEMARSGYEIHEITGGRQIDRYVDIRYRAVRRDRAVTTICRYDTARERVVAIRESGTP